MDLFESADEEHGKAVPSWDWGDPMPEGLTQREALLIQIRRDVRAFNETGDAYYAERAEAYRAWIKDHGGI